MAGAAPYSDERAREIIAAHMGLEGPALPILHALQAEFGCVPEAAVKEIAQALNISRAEMHGVVTFYHDFRSAPHGRHVLKICRAESCQSMGSEKIADEFLARHKTDWHHTTPDGALTIEAVYCLGSAPTARRRSLTASRLEWSTPRRSTILSRRRRANDQDLHPARHGRRGDGARTRSPRRSPRKPRRAASTSRSCATARAECSGWSRSSRSRPHRVGSVTAMWRQRTSRRCSTPAS